MTDESRGMTAASAKRPSTVPAASDGEHGIEEFTPDVAETIHKDRALRWTVEQRGSSVHGVGTLGELIRATEPFTLDGRLDANVSARETGGGHYRSAPTRAKATTDFAIPLDHGRNVPGIRARGVGRGPWAIS